MIRGVHRIGPLVAVLAMSLVLAAPASADQPDRPFSGYAVGYVTFIDNSTDPFTEEPCQFFDATGTFGFASGTTSHLGRFDYASAHCAPGGSEAITGMLTLTAANGDELLIEYIGPTAGELGEDFFTGVYDFTIVGGDGRFEDATGSGEMSIYTTFGDFFDRVWPAEWWFEGSIDY